MNTMSTAHRRFPELFYDTIQESVQRMLAWLHPVSTCRHVVLPREMAKYVPRSHLMSEDEWRQLGVQQSQGWIHYMIHKPEPHILLFRRPLPKN
ncbi:CKS domain-containing protein isoform X1 [Anabas testudineus]|uniref:Cyclin-dependent kinases regulatory subunit n=1 Tax=Anabas testudineus TaxID=64144 RepID=A0AAQ6IFA0_ANATE|nr:CKS domain-containing protein isoform X1 [Anabas testudineus]